MKRGSLSKISLKEASNLDTSSMGSMAEELTVIEKTEVDKIIELAKKINPIYDTSCLSNWESMLKELATEIDELKTVEDVIEAEDIKLNSGQIPNLHQPS